MIVACHRLMACCCHAMPCPVAKPGGPARLPAFRRKHKLASLVGRVVSVMPEVVGHDRESPISRTSSCVQLAVRQLQRQQGGRVVACVLPERAANGHSCLQNSVPASPQARHFFVLDNKGMWAQLQS